MSNFELSPQIDAFSADYQDLTVGLDSFRYNSELGRDIDVVVLVKWTNQRYHDDNLRSMFEGDWDPITSISRKNAWRHRHQYYDGLIVRMSLDNDTFTSSRASYSEHAIQPTAIDITTDGVAIASGNRLYVRKDLDDVKDQNIIRNPWFARLHSVEFTPDGNLITLSSAFDHIFEVDQDGEVVWDMDIWACGRNVNRLGHKLLKIIPEYGEYEENPDVEILKTEYKGSKPRVITDPSTYRGLGLPTNVAPAFVNSISQFGNEQLLATSFRYGESWVVDKQNKEISTAIGNLVTPHNFTSIQSGFMVSDTGRERVLFFDDNLKPISIVDVGVMEDRKQGLEKSRWLQDTVVLKDNLYVTVSSPRQKITIFDTHLQEYRDIDFDPDWGIQTIVNAEPSVTKCLPEKTGIPLENL